MNHMYLITPLLLILMYFYIKIKKLNIVILTKDLILYTEKNMKNVDGITKLNYVTSIVKSELPLIGRIFINQDNIHFFVQEIYNSIYEYLDHKEE